MFMLTSTHQAAIDAKAAELADVRAANDAIVADLDRLRASETRLIEQSLQDRKNACQIGKALNEALKERDAARAELAPLKAAREKANANLRQSRSLPKAEPLPPIN